MSDGCPRCAETTRRLNLVRVRVKKLESGLRELIRLNETEAGDDVSLWANAMLTAHKVLRDSEDEE